MIKEFLHNKITVKRLNQYKKECKVSVKKKQKNTKINLDNTRLFLYLIEYTRLINYVLRLDQYGKDNNYKLYSGTSFNNLNFKQR